MLKRIFSVIAALTSLGLHSQFLQVNKDMVLMNENKKFQSIHLNNSDLILKNCKIDVIGNVTGMGVIKGFDGSIIYVGGEVSMAVRIRTEISPYPVSRETRYKLPAEYVTWEWIDDDKRLLKFNTKYKILKLEIFYRGERVLAFEGYDTNGWIDFSRYLRGVYFVKMKTVSGEHSFEIKR